MTDRHASLIEELSGALTPGEGLWSPVKRTIVWLVLIVATGIAIAAFADLSAVATRLRETANLRAAVVGAAGTACLAAVATFQLSRPQAPRFWAFLPVPALLLWIGASGIGCLQAAFTHDNSAHPIPLAESEHCLAFILGLSLPLGAVLIAMLRRARPAWPGLLAMIAGLSVAASAAALLTLIHPYDAAVIDLAVHVFGIGIVVIVARLLGTRLQAA